MISKDELDKTILELEMRDTTFANCSKLADLYIVRDHITSQTQKQSVPLETSGDSEFLQAVDGKDSVAVWNIMDDLMDTLQTVAPRVYTSIIERIVSAKSVNNSVNNST